MATITKGQTFGVAEQVTNTKLHNLVDLATITGIVNSELANNIMTSLASASGKIPFQNMWLITSLASSMGKVPPQNLWELKTIATNASLVDISTGTSFQLWASTICSLATFVNPRVGQEFTLIAAQASFPGIVDAGNFLLSANWIAAKAGDSLRLVWDGTNFIEVGRVSV